MSAYSKRPDLLVDLDHVLRQLEQATDGSGSQSVQSTGRVGRAHGLQDQLTNADIRKIILSFQDGMPRYKIVELHGVSISSVGRLLRKWRAEQNDMPQLCPTSSESSDPEAAPCTLQAPGARADLMTWKRYPSTLWKRTGTQGDRAQVVEVPDFHRSEDTKVISNFRPG